jgi:hypothetical protein
MSLRTRTEHICWCLACPLFKHPETNAMAAGSARIGLFAIRDALDAAKFIDGFAE